MFEFRTPSAADKPAIEGLCARHPSDSCERSFANIFFWSAPYGTRLMDWNGRIVVYKSIPKLLQYPLGEDSPPELLAELAAAFVSEKLPFAHIYDVPPNYTAKFPNAENYFYVSSSDGEADYLYKLDDLAGLNGPKLRKKRNHVKHFIDENPDWSAEEISPINFHEAEKCAREHAADFEAEAVAMAFDNFGAVGAEGMLLRGKGGMPVGLAVYTRLNADMYDVHFEKSHKSVRGAAQMLVKAEAELMMKNGARFMNREQDVGEPNLRHAKSSLDPFAMYARINLIPKSV